MLEVDEGVLEELLEGDALQRRALQQSGQQVPAVGGYGDTRGQLWGQVRSGQVRSGKQVQTVGGYGDTRGQLWGQGTSGQQSGDMATPGEAVGLGQVRSDQVNRSRQSGYGDAGRQLWGQVRSGHVSKLRHQENSARRVKSGQIIQSVVEANMEQANA